MLALIIQLLQQGYQVFSQIMKITLQLVIGVHRLVKKVGLYLVPVHWRIPFFLMLYVVYLTLAQDLIYMTASQVLVFLNQHLALVYDLKLEFELKEEYFWLSLYLIGAYLLPVLVKFLQFYKIFCLVCVAILVYCPARWKAQFEIYFQHTLEVWEAVDIPLTPVRPLPVWLAVVVRGGKTVKFWVQVVIISLWFQRF